MNIYRQLNELVDYIESNIEDDLRPETMADFLHTNIYTAGKLFTVLTGQGFSKYVRKRRLSLAGQDLYSGNLRVIDVAVKYGYDNATAFSRAFEKFHGIKPSQVNKHTKLKNFPRLKFDEDVQPITELDYEIVRLPQLELYGLSIATNNTNIPNDAPRFFQEVRKKYSEKYGDIRYGMITYDAAREESQRYYCLYEEKIPGFEKIVLPEGQWLRFRIDSEEPAEIQEMSLRFYREFLPSSKYTLKGLPELEDYHDGITDFLVAIE